MSTAQQFFGGTRPRETGKDKTNRQVGTSSAVGSNTLSNNRGQAPHAVDKPATGAFHRPSIRGKVDNRKGK